MGFELNLICCVKGNPLCAESVGGRSAKRKYERDYRVRNRIGCTDFAGDCFFLRNQNCKLWKRNLKTLNSPLSPQNLHLKSETQSKPKTGKIVRVVPMGVPFSPERFKQIQELSQRDPSD